MNSVKKQLIINENIENPMNILLRLFETKITNKNIYKYVYIDDYIKHLIRTFRVNYLALSKNVFLSEKIMKEFPLVEWQCENIKYGEYGNFSLIENDIIKLLKNNRIDKREFISGFATLDLIIRFKDFPWSWNDVINEHFVYRSIKLGRSEKEFKEDLIKYVNYRTQRIKKLAITLMKFYGYYKISPNNKIFIDCYVQYLNDSYNSLIH